MGEAKRRRDWDRVHAAEIAADLERRRAERLRIEEMAATDPEDWPQREAELRATVPGWPTQD